MVSQYWENRRKQEEDEKKKQFDASKWEPCITTEKNEKCQCDSCKRIIEGKKIGDHIFCTHCQKYCWREKC